MKVMKFGGGCLKDAESFAKAVEIIRSETEPPILVVSAIYGVTNMLIEGIDKLFNSENNVSDLIEKIKQKHESIIISVIENEKYREGIFKELDNKICSLEEFLKDIINAREISDKLRIKALSYGERLSAVLMKNILIKHGIESIAMDSDDIGIITDSAFNNATAILPLVKRNLQTHITPVLAKGCVPVITGYFGCTEEGEVTSFGRNGTDYSAAVIACCIGANLLEIWKDVDGFMSADPKIVKGVHRIEKLSYYEAAELSYFGARILHPRTVEPIIKDRIKIRLRNIFDSKGQGTLILPVGYKKKDIIKGVTYNKDIAVLKIRGPGVGYKPGIIGEVGKKLSKTGINIYSVITAQTCINLLIDINDTKKSQEALDGYNGGIIEKIDIEDDIALIAVVGEGLLKTRGLAARVFKSVAEKGINVEMISSGASDVAYYFIVKETDFRTAIEAIHSDFFPNT